MLGREEKEGAAIRVTGYKKRRVKQQSRTPLHWDFFLAKKNPAVLVK